MREIKFRMWDTEEKQFMNHSRVIESKVLELENNGEDRFVFQQYTGLKDKNGREIYEGDIIYHYWNTGHDHMLETTSFVKWHDGAFLVDDKKRSDWMLSMHVLADWAKVEIIGNIYETPELLHDPEGR